MVHTHAIPRSPWDIAAGQTASPENAEVLAALGELVGLLIRTKRSHQADSPGTAMLIHLVKAGPCRVSDLALSMHLDQSTASRHLAHLAEQGLVERGADPNDRRAVVFTITEQGDALARAAMTERIHHLERSIDTWPAADRREFARLLRAFTEQFAATSNSTSTEGVTR